MKIELLNEANLTKAIAGLRERYISEGLAASAWHINNGLCDDFSSDIIARFGAIDGEEISACNQCCFMIGENGEDAGNDIWDSKLLETYWGIRNPGGLTWREINEIHFGDHAWLCYNGKHYDAECPQGAESFFDLPVFLFYIEEYKKVKALD